jgi:acyl carrier protein
MEIEKYNRLFVSLFGVDKLQIETLGYQSIPGWDSVGHMELMSLIEDEFKIQLEIDDIIDFSDYIKGKEILKKYGVEL